MKELDKTKLKHIEKIRAFMLYNILTRKIYDTDNNIISKSKVEIYKLFKEFDIDTSLLSIDCEFGIDNSVLTNAFDSMLCDMIGESNLDILSEYDNDRLIINLSRNFNGINTERKLNTKIYLKLYSSIITKENYAEGLKLIKEASLTRTSNAAYLSALGLLKKNTEFISHIYNLINNVIQDIKKEKDKIRILGIMWQTNMSIDYDIVNTIYEKFNEKGYYLSSEKLGDILNKLLSKEALDNIVDNEMVEMGKKNNQMDELMKAMKISYRA